MLTRAQPISELRRSQPMSPPASLLVLQVLSALGAGALAVIGLFFRGATGTQVIESRYGPAEVLVGGLYEGNSPALVAEGVGWDVVTLAVVVPGLLALAVPSHRGSLPARIASAGGLFYVLYQYHQYAIAYAFGPLLPAFVLVAATALLGVIVALASLPPLVPTSRYPRRLMIGIMAFFPLALVAMWGARIRAALSDPEQAAQIVGHYTTLPVQVMDLVWLAPLGLLLAVLLRRGVAIGSVGAAVVAVKGAAMGFAIVAMVIVSALQTGRGDWAGLALFLMLGLVCGYAAMRGLRSLEPRG